MTLMRSHCTLMKPVGEPKRACNAWKPQRVLVKIFAFEIHSNEKYDQTVFQCGHEHLKKIDHFCYIGTQNRFLPPTNFQTAL